MNIFQSVILWFRRTFTSKPPPLPIWVLHEKGIAGTPDGKIYMCVSAGVAGVTEPQWPSVPNGLGIAPGSDTAPDTDLDEQFGPRLVTLPGGFSPSKMIKPYDPTEFSVTQPAGPSGSESSEESDD